MATAQKSDIAVLRQTLDRWSAAIPDGGSFSADTYDRWYRAQAEPRPPSQATIAKYLTDGQGWAQAVIAHRAAIVAVAPDRTITVPVTCRARRLARWVPRTLSEWADDPSCGCERCDQPTIAQAYPHLGAFLADPQDAQRVTSTWVGWICPIGGAAHRMPDGSAAWVAQGEPYCRECRGRPFPKVPDAAKARPETGSVTDSHNPVASGVEQKARDIIAGAGYTLPEQKLAIWCPHPSIPDEVAAITPDIVLVDHHIAVEVDPCQPMMSHHGSTHRGKEEDDRLRNDLLADAGWAVLRLRLGAEEGGRIGDRDVACESPTVTKKVADALLAALDDLVHNRAPQVRFVPKSAAPRKKATRRSSVVRISPYRYGDQSHIFTWYPDPKLGEKRYLRLAMDGRYLYTHGKPPLFLTEVGLHDVPAKHWRQRLEDTLATLPPVGGEHPKYPWGNELLIAVRAGVGAERVVQDCERSTSIIGPPSRSPRAARRSPPAPEPRCWPTTSPSWCDSTTTRRPSGTDSSTSRARADGTALTRPSQ